MSTGTSGSGAMNSFDRRTLLRRSFFGAGALAYGPMLSVMASSTSAANDTQPVVEIATGKIRGRNVKGVNVFRGLPYGFVAEGVGRYKPAENPKPWAGVRDAIKNGPVCIQIEDRMDDIAIDDILGRTPLNFMSEDCLNLNVFAPTERGKKRPVMVWFHGGGFISGSALEPAYDGTNLARSGNAVVVTVNHRVGPLGHLYLDYLDQRFRNSGNVGVLDLVQALKWVHDNAAAFGGDPDNVTIFGQSGGGFKVCTVLTMPAAKGLVHKAIIESGASVRAKLPEEAEEDTDLILKQLGIGPHQLDRLLSLPAYRVVAAYETILDRNGGRSGALAGSSVEELDRFLHRKVPGYNYAPVLDGSVLPAHPFSEDGGTADVPVIVGTARDELQVTFLAAPEIYKVRNEEEFHAKVRVVAGETGQALAEMYLRKNPGASLEAQLYPTKRELL